MVGTFLTALYVNSKFPNTNKDKFSKLSSVRWDYLKVYEYETPGISNERYSSNETLKFLYSTSSLSLKRQLVYG